MRTSNETHATTRTITCVGFDWRTEVSLKETLAWLHGKTREHWEYSEDLLADVVVFDTSNALALAMVRRASVDGRVFYPSTSDDPSVQTLRPPFGASRLIRCLDAASDRLDGAGHDMSAASAPSLSQRLDDAMRAPGAVVLDITAAGGQRGMLQLEEHRLWWSQPLTFDAVAGLLAREVEVRILGSRDGQMLRELEGVATRPVNPEPLLWAIGCTRSKGTLLNRLRPGQPYRLRRWPNFGVLGRRPNDLRCCSLLMQRPLLPAELARGTGLPATAVNSFLNGCALSGVLEAVSAPAARPAMPDHMAVGASPLGGVLRRIRLALTLE